MREDSLGIYCVEAKKFFYLETGKLHVHNPIPRLRNTLQQRGLIDFNPQTYMNTNDYRIVPFKEAKLEGWEMEPIFISDHIRRQVQQSSEKKDEGKSKRSWGAKGKSAADSAAKQKPKPKTRTRRKPAAKAKEQEEEKSE